MKYTHLFFFKRLDFLLRAGIPLLSAIDIVSKQSRGAPYDTYKHIAQDIFKGKTLSACLEKFPREFPHHVSEMIKAGEESGRLVEYIKIITDEYERRKNMRSKIISSLLYPCLIALSTVALTIFLTFSIFPKVKTLFESVHTTLPLSTRIVLHLHKIIQNYGLYALLLVVLLTTGYIVALHRSQKLKRRHDGVILSLPLIGVLVQTYYLALFFKSVGIMLNSALPIEKTLHHASASLHHSHYSPAIQTVAKSILSGNKLSSSLALFPHLFPQTTIQLVEIGEASGTLSDVCIHLGNLAEEEYNTLIKNIFNLMEPALMVVMGFAVGFIALSIITPLYGITSHLKR